MKRLMEQLGLAGVLGIGVLLFCATFYFSALRPARDELAARPSAAAGTSVSVQPVAHSNRFGGAALILTCRNVPAGMCPIQRPSKQ